MGVTVFDFGIGAGALLVGALSGATLLRADFFAAGLRAIVLTKAFDLDGFFAVLAITLLTSSLFLIVYTIAVAPKNIQTGALNDHISFIER